MKKCWVVWDGDRHIAGVFSTKEAADLYTSAYGLPYGMEPEEFRLNPRVEELRIGLVRYCVCLDSNGELQRIDAIREQDAETMPDYCDNVWRDTVTVYLDGEVHVLTGPVTSKDSAVMLAKGMFEQCRWSGYMAARIRRGRR